MIGFAYTNNNSILTNSISQTNNQSINSCVCQCLLTNGCSALTFYNGSDTCFLINDTMINENEVSLNNTALLLLVNASLNTTSWKKNDEILFIDHEITINLRNCIYKNKKKYSMYSSFSLLFSSK